jgi:hypothetical protein
MELVSGLRFKPKNMTYKETLSQIMTDLSNDDNTVFIGQQIVYRGNPMSTTLDDVPKEKMIEVPVMEETQMGMSLGLAMTGKRVITFYPRWDFLISATNQLVNHVDKYELMTGEKVHIIIRVGKGSETPLDPGHQHKANYVEEFKSLCKDVKIFDCKTIEDLKSYYQFAKDNVGVYIINEYPELYHNKTILNFITDESSENTNILMVQDFMGAGWYEIENYKICDISEITERKDENFYHLVHVNYYLSQYILDHRDIPLTEGIKVLLKNNKNFKVIFITEHECDMEYVIKIADYQLKMIGIPTEQVFIINGNQLLPQLKNEINSKINVHVSNRLPLVITRNIVNFCDGYHFKKDKEKTFMCYNRNLTMHRLGILTALKHHNLLDDTDWSFLRGNRLAAMKLENGDINPDILLNVFDQDLINETQSSLNFFKDIDIKKSEFEDYDVDTPGGGQDWNIMFESNPYKHSYINIVNESQFEKDNLIHITEKTLIPFYYSQFPLIVATHQHIKKTKELYGFDFFEDFFDLSYDNEPNPQKRMKMIIDEIVRVSNKKDQLQGFYQSAKKRFKHNKDIVTSLYDDKTDHNFFQSLINFQ